MSNRRAANMYMNGRMRDREAITRRNPVSQSTMAPFVRCHVPDAPLLAEYETWLAANPLNKHAHSSMTALKLRRAVIMRRGGQTWADITAAIGTNARSWVMKLPPELSA